MPLRVAGTDPGTSSLDVIVLADGEVQAEKRFAPEDLRADPGAPVRWLEGQGPFAIVAGPSGYGLPLVRAAECTERDLSLMALVRPDDRRGQGVMGFSAVVRAFRDSALPVVFLPGVIHLPTVPPHRKLNRIDLGTPDKVCVAALAARLQPAADSACVVELGSAFTACVLVKQREIIAGLGGTSGPIGWCSLGAWDGELAYLMSPLGKADLFAGGAGGCVDLPGTEAFIESVCQAVGGLSAWAGPFDVYLSGRLCETAPRLAGEISNSLLSLRTCCVTSVQYLAGLPGATLKQAAQGAAVLADGLAGGRWKALVDGLRLREASGTVLDWLRHPRAGEVRAMFA